VDTSYRRQLAIGVAIAHKLRTDPEPIIAIGRRNLARLRARQDARRAARWLDEWESTLAEGPSAVIAILESPSDHGHDMRQMTPFAGR
jgi:hypothetical protein